MATIRERAKQLGRRSRRAYLDAHEVVDPVTLREWVVGDLEIHLGRLGGTGTTIHKVKAFVAAWCVGFSTGGRASASERRRKIEALISHLGRWK